MIVFRSKIPSPYQEDGKYVTILGGLINYQELFSYHFLIGQTDDRKFDGGYLILNNERRESVSVCGTIDLLSSSPECFFYRSFPVDITIDSCEEMYYHVSWSDKTVYQFDAYNLFPDKFKAIRFNLMEL